jgi:hypothetical protein
LNAALRAVVLMGLMAGASHAAEPSAVRGVIVTPAVKCLAARSPADKDLPRPKVVSSYPAQGATVRPGRIVIRLTFDVPMACEGTFLDAPPLPSPLPADGRVVKLTPDRRTFRIEGRVAKTRRYALWLNRATERDFKGLSGQPLEPFRLEFVTSDEAEAKTVAEALADDPG